MTPARDTPRLDHLVKELQEDGFAFPAGRLTWGYIGDSEQLSNELIGLIRSGPKRATASLLWMNEAEAEPVPAPGDMEILVESSGRPALVLRYERVDVVPFDEVTEAYAFAEGEGDRSLKFWREVHWAFFSRECAQLGLQPSQRMPVICATFEVMHICKLTP